MCNDPMHTVWFGTLLASSALLVVGTWKMFQVNIKLRNVQRMQTLISKAMESARTHDMDSFDMFNAQLMSLRKTL